MSSPLGPGGRRAFTRSPMLGGGASRAASESPTARMCRGGMPSPLTGGGSGGISGTDFVVWPGTPSAVLAAASACVTALVPRSGLGAAGGTDPVGLGCGAVPCAEAGRAGPVEGAVGVITCAPSHGAPTTVLNMPRWRAGPKGIGGIRSILRLFAMIPDRSGPAPGSVENHDSRLFRLVLRLHVDSDAGVGHGPPDPGLDPVADLVRVENAHLPRNDEVKLDEGGAAGVTGPQVMRLDRAMGLGGDRIADQGERLFGDGLVHQAAQGCAHHA